MGEYAETSPAKSRVIERRRSCLSQIAYELEAETPHQFRSGSPFAYSRYSVSFRSITITWLSAPSTGLEGVVLDPPYYQLTAHAVAKRMAPRKDKLEG